MFDNYAQENNVLDLNFKCLDELDHIFSHMTLKQFHFHIYVNNKNKKKTKELMRLMLTALKIEPVKEKEK